jgi:hexosaminidase
LFRSGTTVEYAGNDLAPIVEWFRLEVARRTGLHLAPRAGISGSNEPSVRIELAPGQGSGVVPAPLGISPDSSGPCDERHALEIDGDQVLIRAVEPVGVARGLTTLIQLLATAPPADAGAIPLPGALFLDGPRYAWRGLSLDLVRRFFTIDEVRRVIDLLALYKLNVLHLHLTDDEGWRLPVGRPAPDPQVDTAFYSTEELRSLVAYAADRFVVVVPEVDTPGHASALMQMHPGLSTGRNVVDLDLVPGHTHHTAWLDPELPLTFELIEDVLDGVAEIFSGPYIHIGGDEPRGMPDRLYSSYVEEVRRLVRSKGRRPLGWQESARAGLSPDDVIQYWFSGITLPASLPPKVRELLSGDLAMSGRDLETAVAASVPVIVSPLSHCYLDLPYAEPSADPAQAKRQSRVGLRFYPPRTVAESFDWEPAEALGTGGAAQVAGVEAAVWGETISDFDDLSFLLLPRLPGVAHKAWSDPQVATWNDHRDRLAAHRCMWAQDNLTYFRTSGVDWL